MSFLKKFIIILLTFFSVLALVAEPIKPPEDIQKISVGKNLEYFTDSSTHLQLTDILANESNFPFQKSESDIPSLDYAHGVHWVRFEIQQNNDSSEKVVLLLSNHSISYIHFFLLDSNNQILSEFDTGNLKPFSSRPIEYRDFAFPFFMEKGKTYRIFLRLQSKGRISVPLTLQSVQYFFKSVAREVTLHGIYFGVMLTMIVYNILILLNGRDIAYLFYSIYILSYTILRGVSLGHAFQFLWPNHPNFNHFAFVFMIVLNLLSSSLLTINFLKTKIYSPFFHKFFIFLTGTGFLFLLLSLVIDTTNLKPYVIFTAPIVSLGVIIASVRVWLRGFKPARYFLFSWLFFYLFIIITVLKIFGVLPENFFTEYGSELGSLVQAIFLSYSLSDKVNEIKKESQEATFRTLQYQEAMKFELEKKVRQRTEELNKYIQSLQKDLQMANSIQMNILPKRDIDLTNFKIVNKYIPLDKVGGDFFDIYEFGPEKIRIFIADATGHGVQAALVTMSIKSEYDGLKSIILEPSELLEELHLRFKQIYRGMKVYFSAVVVDIDLSCNKIIYSSAGHPDQFLIHNGELIEMKRTGKIIGFTLYSEFKDKELKFCKGDKLLLFTDGLYEEFNTKKEQFGEERVKQILKIGKNSSIQDLLDTVLFELEFYLGEREKQDDITIIGVQSL